jgi:leader peptidase (prepilin peptidase)/N-methyltransferase
MEAFIAVAAGLLIGSFLNVCIHRLPRDLSVVWPGSRCPTCLHPIAWFDNIPVLSFLALAARCRHCRSAISWRYPLVELLTAAMFLAGYLTWGPGAGAVKFALFSALVLGMIFSDLQTRILPDEFTKGGIVLGLALSSIIPLPNGLLNFLLPETIAPFSSTIESAFAALFGGGSLWLVGVIYARIRHKEGLGFGDVKMVAMMGAFMGLSSALAAVMLGCIAGSLSGLAYIYIARKDAATYELPFGSFLGAAALFVGLAEPGWLHWYRNM